MGLYVPLEVHLTVFLVIALVDMKALALYVRNVLQGITKLPVQVQFAQHAVLANMHLVWDKQHVILALLVHTLLHMHYHHYKHVNCVQLDHMLLVLLELLVLPVWLVDIPLLLAVLVASHVNCVHQEHTLLLVLPYVLCVP